MKMEQTDYSETSAYKIQTPWNYPEEKKYNKACLFYGQFLKLRRRDTDSASKRWRWYVLYVKYSSQGLCYRELVSL